MHHDFDVTHGYVSERPTVPNLVQGVSTTWSPKRSLASRMSLRVMQPSEATGQGKKRKVGAASLYLTRELG